MKNFIRFLMILWSIILVFTIGLSINYIDTLNVNGVGVNGALTYTLSIRPNTKLTWGKETV